MLKLILRALPLLAVLAVVPAQAQAQDKMDCTAAEMTKMKDKTGAMPDGAGKTMAMKEMEMAEKMMEKKDMDGCMKNMDNAMKAMEKK